MRIGEIARRADCEVQTVRFYEREGLLPAPAREVSGYRNYGAQHLARLNFIRHCRSLDIPLAEIRQLLEFAATPEQSCAQVNQLLDAHIGLIRKRIDSLLNLEKELSSLRQSCAGDSSRACAILESFIRAAEEQAATDTAEADSARR